MRKQRKQCTSQEKVVMPRKHLIEKVPVSRIRDECGLKPAMYYVWENILTYARGRLSVNLLLNRSSAWADVDSHIPYLGQVDVRIKPPVDLSIRIPEWAQPGQVTVQVDGAHRELGWDGRYPVVGEVKPGEVATMTVPIAERTDTVWVEKKKHTLVR